MDTATPTAPATAETSGVRLPLLATLLSPLHHGAGTAGNTGLLRRQDIVLPDGTTARVPLVSGNSVRHLLRAAGAWHLVHTLEVPDGSLSKAVVDLLWSGGAITRTGAQTDLDLARRVEQLLPLLTLMGYSAGSDMVGGVLMANHLHLVCEENAWRLDAPAAALPHAARRAGYFQGEQFGTRHDVAGSAVDRYVQAVGDLFGQAPAPASTQMIYDTQIIKPGAVLAGSLELTAAATGAHRAVLAVLLDEAAPLVGGRRRVRLAAKGAVGFGQADLSIDLAPLGDTRTARAWWEGHLRTHRGQILDLLAEVTA